MSLCKISILKKIRSLPRLFRQHHTILESKGTPLCLRKGSYTLEAAIVIPLVAAFLASIMCYFRVLQVQTDIQEALTYAGRKSAVEGSCISSDTGCLALAGVYFEKEIKKSDYVNDYVRGGALGISLLKSKVQQDKIQLNASCKVDIPIDLFHINGISLQVCSVNRKWVGKTEDKENGETVVYYTETGRVYHTTKSCKYLDLSIHSIKTDEVVGARNKSGHKYTVCSRCAAKSSNENIVFVTDYGTAYHVELGCSGLKRTIYETVLSNVQRRKACSKCGGKE